MTRYISTDAQRQFAQNLAAISGDFHTHALYFAFYDAFGTMIDGFVGNYLVCISMAEALTDWEMANDAAMAYENLGTCWIEIVERYVDALIHQSIETGEIPNPVYILDRVITASSCLP
jgi:membrane-associated PAP2 superfamily phosphatase